MRCGFHSFPPSPFVGVCFVFKQANRPPAKLNLLTCQVKTNPEEKKCFDLISRKFTLGRCATGKSLWTLLQGTSRLSCAVL